jgi:hypothetical protein
MKGNVDQALRKLRWQSNIAAPLNQRKQQFKSRIALFMALWKTQLVNKRKHLKHTVCCVTVPCGFRETDPRRSGEHKVTEKLFAFSGLT